MGVGQGGGGIEQWEGCPRGRPGLQRCCDSGRICCQILNFLQLIVGADLSRLIRAAGTLHGIGGPMFLDPEETSECFTGPTGYSGLTAHCTEVGKSGGNKSSAVGSTVGQLCVLQVFNYLEFLTMQTALLC